MYELAASASYFVERPYGGDITRAWTERQEIQPLIIANCCLQP